MYDDQTITDRVEIEALRNEFTDAVMMRDYDRVASLFTPDGELRIPEAAELTGPAEIRAWGRRVPDLVVYLVQNAHPGSVRLDGDSAFGRVFIEELVCARDGRSGQNYAIYHDRYRRTDDGWRFTERTYEIRYLDTTPLAGTAPTSATGPAEPPADTSLRQKALPATTELTNPKALPLAAGRWELDYSHSSVGFTIKHLGLSKVRGRFNSFQADVVIGCDLADSSIVASVALDSIDTGNRDRDTNVLSPILLDVSRRPTLSFHSEVMRALDAERYEILGHLTIGDVTRPLVLRAEFAGVETSPDGRRHAGFEATGELRRKDFGIGTDIPAAAIGDIVKIELDTELVEPQAAG
jgi:polyisoprenoid-binding protein YceI